MEYYILTALLGTVCGFAVAWILRIKTCPPPVTIEIALSQNAQGNVVKILYPESLVAHPKENLQWVIHNGLRVSANVELSRFTARASGQAKKPFAGDLKATVLPGAQGSIKGKVKTKEELDQGPPSLEQDALGSYHCFTYGVDVNGNRVDPEIRIRV